jgi:hypothetical protein
MITQRRISPLNPPRSHRRDPPPAFTTHTLSFRYVTFLFPFVRDVCSSTCRFVSVSRAYVSLIIPLCPMSIIMERIMTNYHDAACQCTYIHIYHSPQSVSLSPFASSSIPSHSLIKAVEWLFFFLQNTRQGSSDVPNRCSPMSFARISHQVYKNKAHN